MKTQNFTIMFSALPRAECFVGGVGLSFQFDKLPSFPVGENSTGANHGKLRGNDKIQGIFFGGWRTFFIERFQAGDTV